MLGQCCLMWTLQSERLSEKSEGEEKEASIPLYIDAACVQHTVPEPSPFYQTGGTQTPGRRCEDKESGEEQKVNVANEEACMCLENRERGRLSSQILCNCVLCHIRFDARAVSAAAASLATRHRGLHKSPMLCRWRPSRLLLRVL